MDHLNDYIKKNSQYAPNRTIKSKNISSNGKREDIPVIHRIETLKNLYENYEHKDKLCFTTFYNKMAKNIKKPQRLSDRCEYCLARKFLEIKIKKLSEKYDFKWIEHSNLNAYNFKNFLKNEFKRYLLFKIFV